MGLLSRYTKSEKESTMRLHTMVRIATLALSLLVLLCTAEAQQAPRVYRIGWLSAGPPPPTPTIQMQAFQEGLRDANLAIITVTPVRK